MHEKDELKKRLDAEERKKYEARGEEAKLKAFATRLNNQREERKALYERAKVMERLEGEQARLQAYKTVKEQLLKQKQLSELVEHMKIDVLNQKHLEMKWKNEYNIPDLEQVHNAMNPY